MKSRRPRRKFTHRMPDGTLGVFHVTIDDSDQDRLWAIIHVTHDIDLDASGNDAIPVRAIRRWVCRRLNNLALRYGASHGGVVTMRSITRIWELGARRVVPFYEPYEVALVQPVEAWQWPEWQADPKRPR